jgi:hypothetical protein
MTLLFDKKINEKFSWKENCLIVKVGHAFIMIEQ